MVSSDITELEKSQSMTCLKTEMFLFNLDHAQRLIHSSKGNYLQLV